MPRPEAARQAAGERPGIKAAEPHRWSGAPIPSGMSRYRSRGELEMVPGGYRAARGGPWLEEHNSRETPPALAPVRDGSVPRSRLLWVAALLLEVIAADAPGDPDAAALALVCDLVLAEPDRVLLPTLTRVALERFGYGAGHGPAGAALAAELAGPLGEVKRSASAPPRPGKPLTESETRVLYYLPTHLSAREIAAELYLSANTVKTHQRHLYQKLGAHSRQEAVQQARAIGLLTGPSARPRPWP
jgi:LuxR family transcriptional regulator, maltose regulon positive regulatory protein